MYIVFHVNFSDPKWKEIAEDARKEYENVVEARIIINNKVYDMTFDELEKKLAS